ncbi:glycosyltransferase family 61 protein [Algoriphagus zhangzhouensis]|uniref:Glycosyltransferase 61 catalytic domain-containing protein n=1 Tax=Algoriphagus zhangzhouensis TaxID=1073327 RepID=A0A1M7ZII4_9BACT|nr:glycosyltransferase family 61 protein [Algoriphagus zhangzhouensis]TDY44275.1 uncharacterized protein DUF563 [Algoriphagus zhangzhouensis]SHO64486.1 Protein of unknown function [Algoriphagus zhangzhouensis]
MRLSLSEIPKLPAYRSERTLPLNFKEKDLNLFENELSREINSSEAVSLSLAIVIDETIWIWQKFQFMDHLSHSSPWSKKAKIKRLPLLFKPGKFIQKAIWISDNWAHNYFHWMTESIPRLVALQGNFKDYKIFIPERLKGYSYIKDSLEILGYQPFYISSDVKLTVGELISYQRTAPSFNYHTQIINRVRQEFSPSPTQKRKIYISRMKASKRRIVNEVELISKLEEFGYEIHHFEDYGLRDQILLMSEASHLVSMHGAGLTNMLYMSSGSKVMEFRFRGDTTNNCFFTLASELGLGYYYSQNEFENPKIHLNSNMILNLEETFEAILSME